MSDWEEVTIGEVTTNFDARRVPVRAAERKPGPFAYYGASGVVDHVSDYLFDGEYLLVAEDGENLRTRKTPIAFMASGKFWVNNHAHILRGTDRANTRYLCYALAVAEVSGYLSGSTQPKLTQAALNSIRLTVPGRDEQDQVVELLGTLDDKVAVNNRITATAEDLCRAIFSEQSWEARTAVESIAILHKEQVAPDALSEPRVAHYSLPAFDSGAMPEMSDPRSIKSSKFVVRQPSVLLSKLNPEIPRVWNVSPHRKFTALASTEFLVLEPRNGVTTEELWAVLSQPRLLGDLASKVTGTSKSHQRVRPAEVMNSQVVDPRSLGDAREQARTLLGRVMQARNESHTLATLRDTLLPQLISGKLRVRDAEKIVEDAV